MARHIIDAGNVIDLDIESSVRAVYDAEFGRLAGWTTKLVGDPDLAHDFATDAFVKMLRNWSAVREPRAWLYVTVTNLPDRARRRAGTAGPAAYAGALALLCRSVGGPGGQPSRQVRRGDQARPV